jgi:hypothetical protein
LSTNDAPKVTIAVPTYNRAELLDRALSSLRQQTYEDMEIVVCDNASSDATEEVVKRQSDPRIRHHRADTNVGAFKNFELGLQLARGEYFMWAADDDLWKPELVTTLVAVLDGDPSTVLACAEARYMSTEGVAFKHFAEGNALRRRPSRGPLAERLRAILDGHYGNLLYGLYRRRALIGASPGQPIDTVFSVYGPTTPETYGGINELPILLQVAARGAIEVIDSCLWSKATTSGVQRDAHQESLHRDHAATCKRSKVRPPALARGLAATRWRLRPDARYHLAVLKDVTRCIGVLEAPAPLKRELHARIGLRLVRHYLSLEYRQVLAAAGARRWIERE